MVISELWINFKNILRVSHKVIGKNLERIGLLNAEGDVLFHLYNAEKPLTQNDLSHILDIGKAAISRTVKGLEEKGLLTREKNSVDGRTNLLSLTPKGIEMKDDVCSAYSTFYENVLKLVSENDIKTMQKILSSISIKLSAIEKQ